MSTQDVTQMEAGRELDALVAEKVMGLPLERRDYGGMVWWVVVPPEGSCRVWRSPPEYSTDIAAAWLVVEKMREHPNPEFRNLTLTAYCYNRTYATFNADTMFDYDPATWAEANGEHATPLALCRAALLAIPSGDEYPGDRA